MAVCSATLSVAQNVAKIGTTEYATLKEAVDAVQTGAKGYIYILNDASFDDLRIEGKQIIINLVSVSAMLVSMRQKNIAQVSILERYFFVSTYQAAGPDTCLAVFVVASLPPCL